MGRIRTIKPEMLEDARTAELSDGAFRLFVGAILLADDAGRLRADPRYLCGQVFWGAPDGSTTTREQVAEARAELERAQILVVYSVRGQEYAVLRTFAKHQRIDRPSPPKCPGPDEGEGSSSPPAAPAPPPPRPPAPAPGGQVPTREDSPQDNDPEQSATAGQSKSARGLDESSTSPRRGLAVGLDLEGKGKDQEGRGEEGSGEEIATPSGSPGRGSQVTPPSLPPSGQTEIPGTGKQAKAAKPSKPTRQPLPDAEPPANSLARSVRDAIARDAVLCPITANPGDFAVRATAEGMYPGVNILAEVQRAGEFAARDPSRYSDGRAFLTNWLRRSADDAAKRPRPITTPVAARSPFKSVDEAVAAAKAAQARREEAMGQAEAAK